MPKETANNKLQKLNTEKSKFNLNQNLQPIYFNLFVSSSKNS